MRNSSEPTMTLDQRRFGSNLSVDNLTSDSYGVAAPGPGVCANCCAPVDERFEVCWSCAQVSSSLNHPLLPITPISLVTSQSQLYRALRQYKWFYSPTTSKIQTLRLTALLASFLARHRDCIAPERWSLVTVVPSLNPIVNQRVRQHPLFSAIERLDELKDNLAELLAPGPQANFEKRNLGSPNAYRPISTQITNARILLIDDVYTTGAHLQSAYLSLVNAGARSVSALVIGRKIRRGVNSVPFSLLNTVPRSKLPKVPRTPFSIERCIHCV